MMHNITKETEFNKILKIAKNSHSPVNIVFHSLWDEPSVNLLKNIEEKFKGENIYLVNSFDTPHSFVIHNITKVPALVTIKGKRTRVEDKLPAIYYSLGLVDLPA